MEGTQRSKENKLPEKDEESSRILCPGLPTGADFRRAVNYPLAILFSVYDNVKNMVPE